MSKKPVYNTIPYILLGLILLLGSGPIRATVQILPAKMEVTLSSRTVNGTFRLRNQARAPQRYQFRTQGKMATSQAMPAVQTINFDSLISFSPATVILAPGATQTIRYTITPRTTLPAGVYQLLIQVVNTETADVEGETTVMATVEPTVIIRSLSPTSEATRQRDGSYLSSGRFGVDANVPILQAYLEISPLTAIGHGNSSSIGFYPDTTSGVTLMNMTADTSDDQQRRLNFINTESSGMMLQTENFTISSNRPEGLSQQLLFTIKWKSGQSLLSGQYTGSIKLTVLSMPIQ